LHAKLRPSVPAPEIIQLASNSYFIFSPRVVKLLRDFGVDQLETLDVTWSDDTDPEFEGYKYLDVLRLIDSYDYDRSEIVITKSYGRMFGHLGTKRWFRDDIDPHIHAFRDLYNRSDFVISRALARHLRAQKVRGLFVTDPANNDDAFFSRRSSRGQIQCLMDQCR